MTRCEKRHGIARELFHIHGITVKFVSMKE
jgi:hypothetical protein